MSRYAPVSPRGVQAAADVLARELAGRGMALQDLAIITRRVVEAYREVARADTVQTHPRLSETTWLIANMEEGAEIQLEPTTLAAVRSRFGPARRIMDNPRASWQCRTKANGTIRVVRLKDGVPATSRPPVRAPQTLELLSLKAGETITSRAIKRVRGAGQLNQCHRAAAQRVLKDSMARWSVKTAPDGKILLTRTR